MTESTVGSSSWAILAWATIFKGIAWDCTMHSRALGLFYVEGPCTALLCQIVVIFQGCLLNLLYQIWIFGALEPNWYLVWSHSYWCKPVCQPNWTATWDIATRGPAIQNPSTLLLCQKAPSPLVLNAGGSRILSKLTIFGLSFLLYKVHLYCWWHMFHGVQKKTCDKDSGLWMAGVGILQHYCTCHRKQVPTSPPVKDDPADTSKTSGQCNCLLHHHQWKIT